MTDEISSEVEAGPQPEVNDESGQPTEQPASSPGESELSPGVMKRINRLTKRANEAERKLEEATRNQSQSQTETEPELPQRPSENLWVDDPEKAKQMDQAYEKALEQRAEFRAQKKVKADGDAREQEAQRKSEKERRQSIVNNYIDNAIKDGISEDRLSYNESVLTEAQISMELAEYLYADESGGKLVNYLTSNLDVLDKIAGMPATQAVSFIEREVRGKAVTDKPSLTNAPDPIDPTLSARPVKDELSKMAEGYSFK